MKLRSQSQRLGWRRQNAERPPRFAFEQLEPRHLLAVDIFAAGATGEETMAVEVDGQTVQTWTNIGGDYDGGEFQQFTYDEDGITVDRIRVTFVNNGLTSGGADKNLRVDRIVVDGATFQAEAAGVFSTGTWTPDNGCGHGFKASEFLHCNGYFDFAAATSVLRIRAAGATGEEVMELRIDGVIVDTFSGIGGDYDNGQFVTLTHEADSVVSAAQVELAFVNDGTTSGGHDKNIRIDGIEIDGQFFEAEATNVLSTGTWTSPDGCAPGFKQSEFLHCWGSLFFGQGSELRIFAAGSTGEETIEVLIDEVVVATWTHVAGDFGEGIYETFTYVSPAELTADQVRVAFVNDGVDSGGQDKNVRIDAISIDGIRFETEENTVFSTGTWRPIDGCGAGFKLSEQLHCNGYVQYASGAPENPGVVSLRSNLYTVNEVEGAAAVVIDRTQGSDGIVTVDYRSFSGSAIVGEDFLSVSNRAIFFPGETSKVINIPILDDQLSESTETLSFTIDNVTGGATLLVPRTALIDIIDDENPPVGLGGFNTSFADFSDPAGLQLNGDALVVADQLLVTNDLPDQTGSVFFDRAVLFDANASFRSTMQLQLSGGQATRGAEGMTFMLQNTLEGPHALGDTGAGLGYGGIGPGSIAIELDTNQNPQDADGNHISVLINGDVTNPVATTSAPLDLNSGSVLHMWVEYDGNTDLLEVYLADTATQPASPVVQQPIDLANVLGSQAYWGFSAATSSSTNQHKVLAWSLDSSTELVPPPVPFTSEAIVSGLILPTAIDWSNDGQTMYIAELHGVVRAFQEGQLLPTPVVDISSQVNMTLDRGLLGMAVHPDLINHPFLYLLYAYDPPDVFSHTGLAGPDGGGNRAGRLGRFTLDADTNYTTVIPDSEVVILGTNSTWENFNAFVDSTIDFNEPPAGILPGGGNLQDFLAADSQSHTVGQLEFGPEGALYITNGDGTSFNQMDPRTVRVQDIDNLSGKVLRIDPLTGDGLSDNPFYDDDPQSNRSKVYQYGFRNPFRFTIDPTTGQVYVGDVGWTQWEEVNVGQPGDNFGWPYYEGGNGVSLQTTHYENLSAAQAFYASGEPVTAALLGLNHAIDGIDAIVMGDIYDGNVYSSQYQGDLIISELGPGIVRNISFHGDRSIASVETFAVGASIVVQMQTGPDGHLYFVDLDDGVVGRWVESQQAQSGGGGGSGPSGGSATLHGSDGGQIDGASNTTLGAAASGDTSPAPRNRRSSRPERGREATSARTNFVIRDDLLLTALTRSTAATKEVNLAAPNDSLTATRGRVPRAGGERFADTSYQSTLSAHRARMLQFNTLNGGHTARLGRPEKSVEERLVQELDQVGYDQLFAWLGQRQGWRTTWSSF